MSAFDFSFVENKSSREMLENAFAAVTQTESWAFLREDVDTFMFSRNPQVHRILKKMEELGYHQHSGASFGVTMRQMQFIAQYGFEKFKELYQL
jgi:hypothetical protein